MFDNSFAKSFKSTALPLDGKYSLLALELVLNVMFSCVMLSRAAKNIFLSGNLVNAEKFSAKSSYVVPSTRHLCWPRCAEKVQGTF